jgi:hypothetical protein
MPPAKRTIAVSADYTRAGVVAASKQRAMTAIGE